MTSATPKNPLAKKDALGIGIAVVAFSLLLALWLKYSPAGFWEKLAALGYSVCHQIPARTFHVEGHAFPLCARCTGMYLGAMVGLGYHLTWGRKGSFPPLPIMYILAFFVAAFGIDGINSFTQLLPWAQHLYVTTNLTRLISGSGMGVVISAVIAPAFNQTVWANVDSKPALDTFTKLVTILIVMAVLVFGILGDYVPAMYFAAVAGGLSVFVLISVLYTIIAVMVLGRDGKLMKKRQLVLPVLMGMSGALIQISIMTLIRFLITHTWGPINL